MTRTTTIEWPENVLGCPLRAAYSVEVPPMFDRTSLAEAPAAFIRTRHDEVRVHNVDFIWTLAQLDAFETWRTLTINNGLCAFMMKHLAGGELVPMYSMLASPPVIVPLQDRLDRYRVTFSVTSYWRVGATKAIT